MGIASNRQYENAKDGNMIPYHNWPETPIKRIGETVIVHRGTLWVMRRGKEERYCHCDTMAERIAREWEK